MLFLLIGNRYCQNYKPKKMCTAKTRLKRSGISFKTMVSRLIVPLALGMCANHGVGNVALDFTELLFDCFYNF